MCIILLEEVGENGKEQGQILTFPSKLEGFLTFLLNITVYQNGIKLYNGVEGADRY